MVSSSMSDVFGSIIATLGKLALCRLNDVIYM